MIDRLRAGLQARIGTTRDRVDQDPDTEPEALPEKELRADLIAAENAELSRLFEDGTISAATRQPAAAKPGPGGHPAGRQATAIAAVIKAVLNCQDARREASIGQPPCPTERGIGYRSLADPLRSASITGRDRDL